MESTPKIQKKRIHQRGLSSILFEEELRKMQRVDCESETVYSEPEFFVHRDDTESCFPGYEQNVEVKTQKMFPSLPVSSSKSLIQKSAVGT